MPVTWPGRIVAKRADSHYVERRTADWVKVKCSHASGICDRRLDRPWRRARVSGGLAGRVLSHSSDFVYCGRVGTGFTQQSLHDLYKLLEAARARNGHRFATTDRRRRPRRHSLGQTKVVAEVVFAQWTDDGLLRHASFQGIREDKDPTEITREVPADERTLKAHRSAK